MLTHKSTNIIAMCDHMNSTGRRSAANTDHYEKCLTLRKFFACYFVVFFLSQRHRNCVRLCVLLPFHELLFTLFTLLLKRCYCLYLLLVLLVLLFSCHSNNWRLQLLKDTLLVHGAHTLEIANAALRFDGHISPQFQIPFNFNRTGCWVSFASFNSSEPCFFLLLLSSRCCRLIRMPLLTIQKCCILFWKIHLPLWIARNKAETRSNIFINGKTMYERDEHTKFTH